jgi:hypothetical protein
MAYTSPPTFVNGNILTASQLNLLADDVQFLAGIAGRINIPFQSIISGAGSGIDAVWQIRHTHRYLLYYITQNASTSDQMKIRYDGTEIYSDTGDRAAPYLWSGYVDLDSSPGGLTVGDWYQIDLDIVQKTGSGVTQVIYLLESPNTSL